MFARCILPLAGVVLAGAAGCSSPPSAERLNAPPQGASDRRANLCEPFTYMADQALLHDMSVADIHFIPHTTELSGTGVARLTRLSPMLNQYGGIVRYETFERDDKVVAERITHVHEFLVSTGCDMSRVEVKAMLSGGRGMDASDAIRILREGSSNDLKPEGPSGTGAGAAAGSAN